MSERFQLYAGIERDGEWYNYTSVEEIEGGVLGVMKGEDKSSPAKLLNMVKRAVRKFYTADNKEYVPKEYDYEDLVFEDGWKIGMEVMRQFTGQKYPVVDEYFFCSRCSSLGDERYTHVRESWHKLIEDGIIDENYLDDPKQLEYETVLPCGMEINEIRGVVDKGTYTVLKRKHLTLGDMIKVANKSIRDEAEYAYALWDQQIVGVEGLSERAVNTLIKRKTANSFSEKYLLRQADLVAMRDQTPRIGIYARERPVSCSCCHYEIGGGLDVTNFFAFLSSRECDQSPTVSLGMVR